MTDIVIVHGVVHIYVKQGKHGQCYYDCKIQIRSDDAEKLLRLKDKKVHVIVIPDEGA